MVRRYHDSLTSPANDQLGTCREEQEPRNNLICGSQYKHFNDEHIMITSVTERSTD